MLVRLPTSTLNVPRGPLFNLDAQGHTLINTVGCFKHEFKTNMSYELNTVIEENSQPDDDVKAVYKWAQLQTSENASISHDHAALTFI